MKRLILILALLFTVGINAADNDVAGPKYFSGNANQVQWRTTDASGVHTQHVIVASQAASASTTEADITQGVVPVGTPGTAVVLGSGLVESVEIHARKNTTTANTGAVY